MPDREGDSKVPDVLARAREAAASMRLDLDLPMKDWAIDGEGLSAEAAKRVSDAAVRVVLEHLRTLDNGEFVTELEQEIEALLRELPDA